MTKSEVAKMLNMVECLGYRLTVDRIDAINAWAMILAKTDAKKANNAMIEVLKEVKYHPTIGELMLKIKKLQELDDNDPNGEYQQRLRKELAESRKETW